MKKNPLIPYELYPYVLALHPDEAIPTADLPDNLKEKFNKFNKEYSIVNPYAMAVGDNDLYDKKDRIKGRQFRLFPDKILKSVTFSEDTIKLKKNAKLSNEEFNRYKYDYEAIIKFYKYKKYCLLFSPKEKLSLWQYIRMRLGLTRCYYFYGYDEKCPSTVPD